MCKSKEHRETKREERKKVLLKMNSKKLTDYFSNTTLSQHLKNSRDESKSKKIMKVLPFLSQL